MCNLCVIVVVKPPFVHRNKTNDELGRILVILDSLTDCTHTLGEQVLIREQEV